MAANEPLTAGERILGRLTSMGEDAKRLDKRTIEQLRKIEQAVAEELEGRKAALAKARSCDLSISRISKASGISRATFYNKPLLQSYVEAARADLEGEDDSLVARLRARLEEKEEALKAMVARDAELVVMSAENRRLRNRVAALEKYIADMPSEVRADLEAWGHDPGKSGGL